MGTTFLDRTRSNCAIWALCNSRVDTAPIFLSSYGLNTSSLSNNLFWKVSKNMFPLLSAERYNPENGVFGPSNCKWSFVKQGTVVPGNLSLIIVVISLPLFFFLKKCRRFRVLKRNAGSLYTSFKRIPILKHSKGKVRFLALLHPCRLTLTRKHPFSQISVR